jgi:hypothetical protein
VRTTLAHGEVIYPLPEVYESPAVSPRWQSLAYIISQVLVVKHGHTLELDHIRRSRRRADQSAAYSLLGRDIAPSRSVCHSIYERLCAYFRWQPTKVMAYGVKLNGSFGFSLFRHSSKYSLCESGT